MSKYLIIIAFDSRSGKTFFLCVQKNYSSSRNILLFLLKSNDCLDVFKQIYKIYGMFVSMNKIYFLFFFRQQNLCYALLCQQNVYCA